MCQLSESAWQLNHTSLCSGNNDTQFLMSVVLPLWFWSASFELQIFQIDLLIFCIVWLCLLSFGSIDFFVIHRSISCSLSLFSDSFFFLCVPLYYCVNYVTCVYFVLSFRSFSTRVIIACFLWKWINFLSLQKTLAKPACSRLQNHHITISWNNFDRSECPFFCREQLLKCSYPNERP